MKSSQLLKIKAQMSSIWAKGYMLMTVCMLSDLTSLPLLVGGRRSWYVAKSMPKCNLGLERQKCMWALDIYHKSQKVDL